MSKLTIDFTQAEKRKLWRAGISLKRLDEYTLNDLLNAVKPNPDRQKEIRRQFFDYVSDDKLETGISSLLNRNTALEKLLPRNYGLATGIDLVSKIANRQDTLTVGGLRGILGVVDKHSAVYRASTDAFRISQGLNDSLASSGLRSIIDQVSAPSRMISEMFKPLQQDYLGLNKLSSSKLSSILDDISKPNRIVLEQLNPLSTKSSALSAALSDMDMLSKNLQSFQIGEHSTFMKSVTAIDRIVKESRPIFSQSLIEQEIFKKMNFPTLTESLSISSTIEKTFFSEVNASLASTSNFTNLAQINLGSFDWESFGSRIKLSATVVKTAQNDFLNLTSGYSDFLQSLKDKPNWIYDGTDTAKAPAQDYYLNTQLLKIVSSPEEDEIEAEALDLEIAEENEDTIKRYLPIVHKDLPELWEGALQAMQSNNPDKIRHMITSLRELYTHVLHILVPDDQYAQWDVKKENYHEGRPTRRGRFLYLSRNLDGSGSQFAKLLRLEIDSTLAMIELFQAGTHGIKPSIAPNELQFIKIKAESTLRTFLSLEFEINRNS